MKYLLLILSTISLSTNAFCQNNKHVSIQYISLNDSVLVKEIKSTIGEETSSNDPEHLFENGFGYINVYINSFINSDTIYSFYILPSFHYIKKNAHNNEYPCFYTYILNKLVLIYIKTLNDSIISLDYSLRSKARLRKKISSFLEEATDRTFYDSSNHKVFRDKHFRLERFRFDSGKSVFIMKNSAPKIVKENNLR